MNNKKYLIKNTLLYSISTFSTKIISFFMVSFYTTVLTTEIYGKVDIIFATISLFIPIVSLSINNSILRFCLEKNINKGNVLLVGLSITSFGSVIALVIGIIISNFVPGEYHAIMATILLITEVYYLIFLEYIRGIDRNGIYVIINIILVVLTVVFNILLLGCFKLEIYGYLLSYILSYFICIFVMILYIKPVRVLQLVNKFGLINLYKNMLNYCVYLIPNSVFWWITSSSDKYLIVFLIGSAFNGIYSVANKIPTIVTYAFQVFLQAWQLSAIKEKGTTNEDGFSNDIFRMLFLFLSLVVSGLLLILKPFIHVYVNASYYISWQPASFLILTAMYNILSSFVGIRYVVEKKNKMNMYTTLIGALINVVLNIILIPIFHLNGAAIATLISYVSVFFIRIFDTKKFLETRISKMQISIMILLMVQLSCLFIGGFIEIICGMFVLIFIIIASVPSIKLGIKLLKNRRKSI